MEKSDISKILFGLREAKKQFGTTSEMPDKEKNIRDITKPVESASKLLNTFISDDSKSITISSLERQEFQEIVLSDTQKIREEAQVIVDLESQLWTTKKRYTQRIDSLERVAKTFELIDLELDESGEKNACLY